MTGSGDRSGGSAASGATESAPEPFAVALDAVAPSQLYLNGRKLSLVTEWFDFEDPNYDSLPVRRFEAGDEGEGRWTLTDGHTRAFAAYLSGADRLRVARDTDDLDVSVYREGVTEIPDLAGQVLNADAFEEKWVARCRSAAERR